MSAGAQFHEGIANTWTQGYQSGSFLKRLRLFRKLIQSSVSAGSSWLDLGCGSGVLTQEILKCDPARIIAVDGAPSMLEHAKAGVGKTTDGLKVSWHLSDVSSLPFLEPGQLDGVLCSSVIEYLPDPTASIREMRRVLRPGGHLLISVPISSSFVRRAQKSARSIGKLIGKDMYPYLEVSRFEIRKDGATRLLEPLGFKCLVERRFDPVIPQSLQGICDPSLLIVVAEAR